MQCAPRFKFGVVRTSGFEDMLADRQTCTQRDANTTALISLVERGTQLRCQIRALDSRKFRYGRPTLVKCGQQISSTAELC